MNKDEVLKKILEEEDYIKCPKCSNSLNKFMMKNSDGVKNSIIGRLLMMTEQEVEEIFQEAIKILRKDMKD